MSDLVESARKYLGVPFRHRGRTPRALDCAGLVVLAAQDIGINLPDLQFYGREPFRDGLVQAATAALGRPLVVGRVPIEVLIPGDVVLIRYEIHPHHVAIVGSHPLGGLTLIHANADIHQRGKVVEQRLDNFWLSRITHVYRTGH